jgi:hypothetical protein
LKRLQVHFKQLQKFVRVPTNIANPFIQNDSVPLETKELQVQNIFLNGCIARIVKDLDISKIGGVVGIKLCKN